mmetsp:Transcript_126509/g.393790  ORF Transcript_126509/g.393790 Transcript_126509/m.393790 type:complete len:511 (-) Transcript_126509:44-1576(-)
MWPFRAGKTLSAKRPNRRQEGARTAILVLSCINLLNMADRIVPSAVKSLLKRDFHLTDTQTSLLATGMLVVFMITAVVCGWVTDMRVVDRRKLLAAGVAFWSLATGLAGFARSFTELLILRSLVGVGEATFLTVALPMISDFYPIAERNMAFLVLNMAVPIGSAVGFAAGGLLGAQTSWRVAFFVCGFPGILISCLVLTLNDPCPGVNDPGEMRECAEELRPSTAGDGHGADRAGQSGNDEHRSRWVAWGSTFEDMRDIISVPHWSVSELGMVANIFALGVMHDWFGTYLIRTVPGATVQRAGIVMGGAAVVGGVVGTVLGSKTAQFMDPHCRNALLLVPGLFMVPACVLAFLAVNCLVDQYLSYAFVLSTHIFFPTFLAPMYTVQQNCMPVHLRARASGLAMVFTHLLGNVISPPIVGAISDATGSLQVGMQLSWIMIAVAGAAWSLGSVLLEPLPGAGKGGEGETAGAPAPSLVSLLCSGEEECEEEEETPPASSMLSSSYGAAVARC